MIAMMIIMILTNKEWCRFIANNVVLEPLSLKLPMCVLTGVTCMCGECVYGNVFVCVRVLCERVYVRMCVCGVCERVCVRE